MIRALSCIAFVIIIFSCVTHNEVDDNQVLAYVGNQVITIQDFLRRSEYSIRPAYCRQSNYIHKKIVLNSLIAEKMTALEMKKRDDKILDGPNFKKFLKGRGVDKTATLITRFAGSFMVAIVLMAIYVAFIRSGGLNATWAFFNLVFIINVSILAVNFYTLKIDKTGLTKKTKNDGIYAPLVLVIISALLCYGLADKIYV